MRDRQTTLTSSDPLFAGVQYTKKTWPYLSFEYISDHFEYVSEQYQWIWEAMRENELRTSAHSWDVTFSGILHNLVGWEHLG